MNIIKEGNPNYKLCEQKRFKCDFCDCMWEANRDEYFYTSPAHCKCPNCGAIVYELGSYKRSLPPLPPISVYEELIFMLQYLCEADMITDQYTEITDIFENESDANKLKEYIESKIDGEVYVDEFTVEKSVNLDNYFI